MAPDVRNYSKSDLSGRLSIQYLVDRATRAIQPPGDR